MPTGATPSTACFLLVNLMTCLAVVAILRQRAHRSPVRRRRCARRSAVRGRIRVPRAGSGSPTRQVQLADRIRRTESTSCGRIKQAITIDCVRSREEKTRAGSYCRVRRLAPVGRQTETGSTLCAGASEEGSHSVAHSRKPAQTIKSH